MNAAKHSPTSLHRKTMATNKHTFIPSMTHRVRKNKQNYAHTHTHVCGSPPALWQCTRAVRRQWSAPSLWGTILQRFIKTSNAPAKCFIGALKGYSPRGSRAEGGLSPTPAQTHTISTEQVNQTHFCRSFHAINAQRTLCSYHI